MRRRVATILCAMFLSSFLSSACGKKKDKRVTKVTEAAAVYNSSFFSIPEKEGYNAFLSNVFLDNEDFCVTVFYSNQKEGQNHTDIFTVNDKGEISYTLELPGNQLPETIISDEYVFLGVPSKELVGEDAAKKADCVAVFIDKKTGELKKTVKPEFEAESISLVDNGFVIIGNRDLAKYSLDGTCLKTVHTKFPIVRNTVFEDNGLLYFVGGEEDEEQYIYQVDFENKKCDQKVSLREMSLLSAAVTGNHAFTNEGEYRIDMTNLRIQELVNWNNVDIRPPRKMLQNKQYFAMDDDRFALMYEYDERNVELLLLSRDPSEKASEKTIITIGGCRTTQDISLQWLIYQFNTTNKEYRAVIDRYDRFFGGNEEALRKGRLEMVQYFNDGNAPDIFYGSTFDYEYMGRAGMVSDLKPYLDRSSDTIDSLTETARKLMINEEGKCFQLFSSYWLDGYVGLEESFPNGNEVSIFDVHQLALEKSIPPYLGTYETADDIVSVALMYDFPRLWGLYDKQRVITDEDLNKLVDTAVELQKLIPRRDGVMSDISLKDQSVLLQPAVIKDYYSFARIEERAGSPIVYVGFPSVDGSAHPAIPSCQMAMSSATNYPDKCWELMSGIFSEEIQKIASIDQGGAAPINQKVMDMICQALMKPDEVEDEVIKSLVQNKTPAKKEYIESYLKAVYSADVIFIEDRRLLFLIEDEVQTYYSQNRSYEQIAKSLEERLDLFAQENYG